MRLIDADAFLKDILTAGIGKTIIEYSESNIGYMIRRRPTIDAVPVIRCKDCAVPHNKYTGCPKLNGLVTPPDFYCPFGERKDGADNG